MTDDAGLIEQSRAGDLVAYGALVRRHQYDALRVATAVVGPDHAPDAVQEAFVRAFGALGGFDTARPFRPWLMVIVANSARNQRRSLGRWRRAAERYVELGAEVGVDGDAPEDHAVRRSIDDDLIAAIESLPSRQRQVVTARYLLDLNEQETADALRIPNGTVKSRLARGLSRLETLLRSEADDGEH